MNLMTSIQFNLERRKDRGVSGINDVIKYKLLLILSSCRGTKEESNAFILWYTQPPVVAPPPPPLGQANIILILLLFMSAVAKLVSNQLYCKIHDSSVTSNFRAKHNQLSKQYYIPTSLLALSVAGLMIQ